MAGRIPQTFIDDLLDRTDIVDVIDRRVKLKKTGKNYSARCPFHDEKTPSFSVSPDKQFYYCFGCGAGGNAIGFVMDYENIDFPQAVENLAGALGLEVPREASQRRGPGSGGNEAPPNKALYDLLERCAAIYREELRKHPERQRAVDYLKGRGLSGTIARDFGLGFAPPGWDNVMARLGDEKERDDAHKAGILVRNEAGRSYDRFRDRIIFPIRDRRGRVIAFGGRVLGDDKPKYLNSPESPVFHKGRELYGLYEARRANRSLERIIVVEGYMDVIALAQAGITFAVATLGTATSTDHLERLFRMVPEVVFCFDGDEAGRKAAERALHNALPSMSDGRQARFLFLREGEDPDSLVRKEGADAFMDLVQQALPLEEFLFQRQAEGLELGTMEGRASLTKRALPLLRQLPEGVFRELMFQSLAERSGITLEILLRLETPPAPAPPAEEPPPHDEYFEPPEPAEATPRKRTPLAGPAAPHGNITQMALALLLHKPSIAQLAEPGGLDHLDGHDGGLLRDVLELLHKRPESSTGMLLGHWHGTPEGELLAHLAGQERLIPSEGIEAQFGDILRRLMVLPLRQRIIDEINELKSRPYSDLTDDDKTRLGELLRSLRDLDKRSSPSQSAVG